MNGDITTSDERGAFVAAANLPVGWRDVRISITRDGFEPTFQYVARARVSSAELRIYPTIVIRPGEAIETIMTLGQYSCGDEDWMCRRVVLDAPAGAPVRLTAVTATDGPEKVGMSTTRIFFGDPGLRYSMTLIGAAEFWIMGARDVRVTLTAALDD